MPSRITDPQKDFPQWYQDVVYEADLAEHAPVKGCMIIKPYGYAIWERMRDFLDREIKRLGVQNVYFPLFIPEHFLTKESEHVEGFAPEVAWVTHGGGKELEEKYAVRPTSETIMYDTFSRWVQSYRDLPLKINQWANVVRWEMRPRLFLRTLEFLWQEGHTAHATSEEAEIMVAQALRAYQALSEEVLSIAVVPGRKSDAEKFAGADYTTTIEGLMRDGKALQMGTSHHLGQNFAKAFDITFLNAQGEKSLVWQTSWGVSTRMIGGLVMAHGDKKGLVLPPRIAPTQVVIVPIGKTEEEMRAVASVLDRDIIPVLAKLTLWDEPVRYYCDDRRQQTPGWKYNHWEVKGVPLRIEIGPKDVAQQAVMIARRDTGEKSPQPLSSLAHLVPSLLKDIQAQLLTSHRAFTDAHTHQSRTMDEFLSLLQSNGGFLRAPWCGSLSCEKEVKARTKATIRLVGDSAAESSCLICRKPATLTPYFAVAY